MRTRRPNTTSLAATRMLDFNPRPAVARASATLLARKVADDQVPCSRRRFRPRRCSDSSSAGAGRLAGLSVCPRARRRDTSGCRRSWQETEYKLIRVQAAAAASSTPAQASFSTLEEAVLESAYTSLAAANHEDDLILREARAQNRRLVSVARCPRFFPCSSSSSFLFSPRYSAANLHPRDRALCLTDRAAHKHIPCTRTIFRFRTG